MGWFEVHAWASSGPSLPSPMTMRPTPTTTTTDRRSGRAGGRRATQRSINRRPQLLRRTTSVGGLGQVANNDEMPDTGIRQSGDPLGGHAACHEHRNAGACAGLTDVAQPGPRTAGLGGRGLHGPRRDVGDRPGPPRPRGRPDRGSTARRWRRGPGCAGPATTGASSWPTWTPSAPTSSARSGRSFSTKGTPWSRHTAAATAARASSGLASSSLSRSWTTSTPPAMQCRGSRPGRAGPACRGRGGAARGRDPRSRRAVPAVAAFALAFAFSAFLVARTLARLSGLVMSATESELPSLP